MKSSRSWALSGSDECRRTGDGVGVAVDEGRAAAQLADLGEEFARPLPCDRHHMPEAVTLRDSHDALEQHEHARARFTCGEQPRAAWELLDGAEACDARNLGVTEHRESLVKAAAVCASGGRCGHEVELHFADPSH